MEPFFEDYLERLHKLDSDFLASFEDLPAEALDWVPGVEMNSFCVLAVHTTGASRFWIGDVGLGEPSGRNRAAEFQAKGLSLDELKARFAALEAYARAGLERLTLADLATVSPVVFEGKAVTVGWGLLHALEHLGLHLGHAQLTRQLWQRR
jgi:hypothetical protein